MLTQEAIDKLVEAEKAKSLPERCPKGYVPRAGKEARRPRDCSCNCTDTACCETHPDRGDHA